jgi:hypothetical protein
MRGMSLNHAINDIASYRTCKHEVVSRLLCSRTSWLILPFRRVYSVRFSKRREGVSPAGTYGSAAATIILQHIEDARWNVELFLAYFHYFEKKVGLCDYHAVCVCVYPPYKLLNGWTTLYETWYVYHGTWAHINGVVHKSLPSVCVPIGYPPPVARQRLGKNVTSATNTHATIEELVDASFYMRFVSY